MNIQPKIINLLRCGLIYGISCVYNVIFFKFRFYLNQDLELVSFLSQNRMY